MTRCKTCGRFLVQTQLPTGLLTLAFTDIEGSTLLAGRLGDEWPAVLAAQRTIVRDAFARFGAHEVDVTGDGFLFVFPEPGSAATAADAAEACQRAILAHDWPEGAAVRLRIGLHSASLTLTDDGYAGLELHKGARIGAAANGGQVLLSQTVRDRLDGRPVRDLGEFRLKDLRAAERLYELALEGLPVGLQPRSLNATNLPVQPLPLIGRKREVDTALDLLRGRTRLVTFTGPGGIGKTRLALDVAAELARDFHDAVYWVPLATIDDSKRVPDVIASMVGAPSEGNGLVRALRDRDVLLVADNFEHVLAAAPVVAELLGELPRLKILVTSREPLHLSAEIELHVEALSEAEAVELFSARAQAVRRGFEASDTTVAICRKLEYIPLAVELAAARLRHFGEATLLARLDHSLDVLTGGPADLPERQRTLRNVIAWSYDLLAPAERRLLARLAVFAGRATIGQIEQVCGVEADDVLLQVSSLVDKSLVRWLVQPGEEEHYFMLEAVRAFALERLGAEGDDEPIRRRHRDVFLELAESLDPIRHMAGIAALVPERNNLRAALRWSLDEDPTSAETLRLAYVLWRYWLETGSISEGRAWLDEALEAGGGDPAVRARALDAAALLAAQRGDFAAALELNDRGREIAEADDVDDDVLGWVFSRRGQIEIDRGALDEAEFALERALSIFRRTAQPLGEAWALIEHGRVALLAGDNEPATERFRDAIALGTRAGEAVVTAYARALYGSALGFAGALDTGLFQLEAGLAELGERAANFTLTIALLHGAPTYRLAGLAGREREAVRYAIRLALDSGVVPRATACLEAGARLAADAGRFGDSLRLWGASDRIVARLGVVPTPLRRSLRAPVFSEALAALDPGDVERERERGEALGVEEALDFALHVLAD